MITPIPAGNPAFPCHRHPKSSFPQMPVRDIDMKAGIFPGVVIIVAGGKLYYRANRP